MAAANINRRIHVVSNKTEILSIVQSIANKSDQEKAILICNINEVVRRYEEWKFFLPNVLPYYAVKCNDNPMIIKALSALGSGFDCSSKLEIDTVLELGINKDRIIFAHTTKLISHINYAAVCGVSLMTFDSEQELNKIKMCHPDARLLLRFRCDDETALVKLGIKFGCDPSTEIENLLEISKKNNLKVVGVCFHVGSGSNNPKIFHKAIKLARGIFDLAERFGYSFNILDIGGGYPGTKKDSIAIFAQVINKAIDTYFSDPRIKIIAEPGSYFVASCGTIAANIHSARTIEKINHSGEVTLHNMYYINDGYYGSFNNLITHQSPLSIEPLQKSTHTNVIQSSIWGPTCDSKDKLCDTKLPQMKIGDWIVFHDVGDYTVKAASEFNGFLKPDIYVTVSEEIRALLQNTSIFDEDDFIYNCPLLMSLEK